MQEFIGVLAAIGCIGILNMFGEKLLESAARRAARPRREGKEFFPSGRWTEVPEGMVPRNR